MPDPALNRELLASMKIRILAVQRVRAGRWWNYRRVISPFSRLWLGISGQATVRQNGARHKLTAGSLHLVPAFTEHDCSCATSFDHYYLHFTSRLPTDIDLFGLYDCDCHAEAGTGVKNMFRRLESIYPDRKLPCFDPFREDYRKHPSKLEQAQQEASPPEWLEAQGIARILLAPFLKSARHHSGIHARATGRFLAVQEYIREHIAEPVTLSNLARITGLHPTYFSDSFARLVGIRPMEYLMRRRIEHAQYLLLTTTAPAKQIACDVGIPDPAYFNRVFSRFCKCPPARYRERHQG